MNAYWQNERNQSYVHKSFKAKISFQYFKFKHKCNRAINDEPNSYKVKQKKATC